MFSKHALRSLLIILANVQHKKTNLPCILVMLSYFWMKKFENSLRFSFFDRSMETKSYGSFELETKKKA